MFYIFSIFSTCQDLSFSYTFESTSIELLISVMLLENSCAPVPMGARVMSFRCSNTGSPGAFSNWPGRIRVDNRGVRQRHCGEFTFNSNDKTMIQVMIVLESLSIFHIIQTFYVYNMYQYVHNICI